MSDFIKTTNFALVGNDNEIFIRSIHEDFTKVAEEDQFDKAIMEYVHTTLKPKKGKSYFLINAMGASDYFGSNLNADWFSEPVLEDHHKSFETEGYAYRHHVNKDPKIAQGKVVFSAYNKKMHRVELIVEVDDEKVQDILDKLSKKEIPATSMACKVSHDICSICGNKAKSRQDYCVHLKYFKNKIHSPSTPIPGATKYGQKVYAINPDPRFFDISFVKIPADATSSVLTKLAEAFTGKKAEMTKEVKTPITNVKSIPEDWVEQAHGRLTKEEMKKLLEKNSSHEIMTHMVQMNMIPSRRDFQYMYLSDNSLEKYAEVLYDNNITFDCTGLNPDETIYKQIERTKFNTGLAEKLAEFGERLGMGEPLVVARILSTDLEKTSEQKEVIVNTVPYFAGMGGAYYGYNKWLDWKNKKGLGDLQEAAGFKSKLPPAGKYTGATWLMRQHPLLLATGLVGAGILANAAQKAFLKGKEQFDKNEPVVFQKRSAAEDAAYFKNILKRPGVGQFLAATGIVSPLVFLYSAYNRDKLSKGEPVSHLGSFAAHHPFLAAASGVGATYIPGKILKGYDKGTFGRVKTASLSDYVSYLYLYDNDEYNKIYSDLIR